MAGASMTVNLPILYKFTITRIILPTDQGHELSILRKAGGGVLSNKNVRLARYCNLTRPDHFTTFD